MKLPHLHQKVSESSLLLVKGAASLRSVYSVYSVEIWCSGCDRSTHVWGFYGDAIRLCMMMLNSKWSKEISLSLKNLYTMIWFWLNEFSPFVCMWVCFYVLTFGKWIKSIHVYVNNNKICPHKQGRPLLTSLFQYHKPLLWVKHLLQVKSSKPHYSSIPFIE